MLETLSPIPEAPDQSNLDPARHGMFVRVLPEVALSERSNAELRSMMLADNEATAIAARDEVLDRIERTSKQLAHLYEQSDATLQELLLNDRLSASQLQLVEQEINTRQVLTAVVATPALTAQPVRPVAPRVPRPVVIPQIVEQTPPLSPADLMPTRYPNQTDITAGEVTITTPEPMAQPIAVASRHRKPAITSDTLQATVQARQEQNLGPLPRVTLAQSLRLFGARVKDIFSRESADGMQANKANRRGITTVLIGAGAVASAVFLGIQIADRETGSDAPAPVVETTVPTPETTILSIEIDDATQQSIDQIEAVETTLSATTPETSPETAPATDIAATPSLVIEIDPAVQAQIDELEEDD